MPAPLPFADAARALKDSRSVYLTVHQRPDGDALGSQLALAIMLRHLGIRPHMANEDPVPGRFRFLPLSRLIRTGPAGLPAKFDAAIVLECANLKRAGNCGPPARRARVLINMDHHQNNHAYGTYNLVDPSAPATVTMAETLREMLGTPLTPDIATSFYAGIHTETGGFRYSNTTVSVLRLASRLVEAGADPCRIGNAIYERMSARRLKLLGHALGTLDVRDGVAWMSLTRNDFISLRAREEDAEELVDYPRSVANVKVAAFLREVAGGRVRVSLRAKSDVPVNRIARHFGGGGHAYAAGCTVERATIPEARRRLTEAVRKEMRRSRT